MEILKLFQFRRIEDTFHMNIFILGLGTNHYMTRNCPVNDRKYWEESLCLSYTDCLLIWEPDALLTVRMQEDVIKWSN